LYLYQEEEGFLFNSDAHFLYDFVSRFRPKGEVLDIGCGCGIVGLLTARDFPINLDMIDRSPSSITLAKENARVNGIDAAAICDDFLTHRFKKEYDIILSNPPYYHEGADESPTDAVATAKSARYLPFEEMVTKINTIIKPRGSFIFCYDAKQLPYLLSVLRQKRFIVTDMRFIHGTSEKPAQLVLIRAQKGSRSLCKTHPPLIHFKEGKQSEEVKKIYQKTRTYSIKCKIT
jgi:tRNA1(Val) A37 N6-methylase TrmN6